MRRRLLRATLVVAALVLAVRVSTGLAASHGAVFQQIQPRGVALTHLRCFGAASRDPAGPPCSQPRLRLAVVPTPDEALLIPDWFCTVDQRSDELRVCGVGAPAAPGRRAIALIGDSHAASMRSAVDALARRRGWQAFVLAHAGCTFSRAIRAWNAESRASCERWKAEVLAWLAAHPEVDTVLVTSYVFEDPPMIAAPGRSRFATEVGGFAAMWRAIPATVRRVFVIRDVPHAPLASPDCIDRAMRRHRPPGPSCAYARKAFLPPDPAASATRALRSPRYRLVDLTPLMCGPRRCLPVVGGALVHRDTHHLTQTFSATLAPFILRAMDRARP